MDNKIEILIRELSDRIEIAINSKKIEDIQQIQREINIKYEKIKKKLIYLIYIIAEKEKEKETKSLLLKISNHSKLLNIHIL